MSFLFIPNSASSPPCWLSSVIRTARDLPKVIQLIHARAEIQLQHSILPGSLVSLRDIALRCLSLCEVSLTCCILQPLPGPAHCPKAGTCLRSLPLKQDPVWPVLEIQVTTLFSNPTTPFYPPCFPFPHLPPFSFSLTTTLWDELAITATEGLDLSPSTQVFLDLSFPSRCFTLLMVFFSLNSLTYSTDLLVLSVLRTESKCPSFKAMTPLPPCLNLPLPWFFALLGVSRLILPWPLFPWHLGVWALAVSFYQNNLFPYPPGKLLRS